METLTSREHDVLKLILEDYITTAQPVGSRAVSKRSELGLSPASMRTVMADLTDKGYLEQPHTSAGRIPTARAFRFYLDSDLAPRPVTASARKRIRTTMASAGLDTPHMLTEASKLMAGLTHQISMVISPGFSDAKWKEIDFVQVKPGLALAVLVLEGGEVTNKLLEVEDDCTGDVLRTFANFLNETYQGKPLSEVRARIRVELADARFQLSTMCYSALLLAKEACDQPERRDIFMDGAANLLRHAEFADVARMRELLQLLEERGRLLTLLDKMLAQDAMGVQITLGQEEQHLGEGLGQLSVITAIYGDKSTTQGSMAVIGPLRMDYASILPTVDYISQTLTSLLKSRY